MKFVDNRTIDAFDIPGVNAGMIDTHMHLFRQDLPLADSRPYAPEYNAEWSDYETAVAGAGISGAVIIQPSFLGTDNSYLVACLETAPIPARGVAVVGEKTSADVIRTLHRSGVRGLRFNLLSHDNAEAPAPEVWRHVFDDIRPLGWHIELHVGAAQIPDVLHKLEGINLPLVIDHFGRPKPADATSQKGFDYLVSRGNDANLFCKVSAPYRLEGLPADQLFQELAQSFTFDRLLWASDWPWTRHEGEHTFAQCITWRDKMLADDADARSRMDAAARKLFDFP